MNRRAFIKAITVATGAAALAVKESPPEVYDHWNQRFKGRDRRTYIKRDPKWSEVHFGRLRKTDPPRQV